MSNGVGRGVLDVTIPLRFNEVSSDELAARNIAANEEKAPVAAPPISAETAERAARDPEYKRLIEEQAARAAAYRQEHGDFALAATSSFSSGPRVTGWGPPLGNRIVEDDDSKPGIPFIAI